MLICSSIFRTVSSFAFVTDVVGLVQHPVIGRHSEGTFIIDGMVDRFLFF